MPTPTLRAATPAGVAALVAAVLLALLPGVAAARVEIDGLSRTTAKAVRAGLALEAESCTAPAARVARLFRRSEREIRSALEVYGYFAPTVQKSLTRERDCWVARYTVDRGPRVKLRAVDVRLTAAGSPDPALDRLAARRPFAPGDGLNQRTYDDYKQAVLALARQRGYFDGRFTAARIAVFRPRAASCKLGPSSRAAATAPCWRMRIAMRWDTSGRLPRARA